MRTKSDASSRRTALLQAALALFGEKGYPETRVEDVARRAGVAKGTVYLYFRDKPAICIGLFVWLLQQALALTAEIDALPLPPRQKLEKLFSTWASGVASSPQVLSLLSMENVNQSNAVMKRFRKQVLPLVRQVQDAIAHIVRQGIRQGEFRPVDGRAAATLFLASFHAELLAGGKLTGRHRPIESVKEIFLHGLLTRPQPGRGSAGR
uniref:TetR/AcrR family transcriptional regulator n=1 Tax=candidate division WOR-3 bacterium TaxID=2052148 RepID=A0A7C4GCU9_UNCW3